MVQDMTPLGLFEWVCGGLGAAVLSVLGMVVGGYKRADDGLSKVREDLENKLTRTDVEFTSAVSMAKREAAEALMAHSQRTDLRIENGRAELNAHVNSLSARIDRLGDDMARKSDILALDKRMEGLGARLDRILEHMNRSAA